MLTVMGTEFQKMIAQRQTPEQTRRKTSRTSGRRSTRRSSERGLSRARGRSDRRARPGTPRARAGRAPRRTGRAPGEPRNVAYLYILPGLAAYLALHVLPAVADGAPVVLRLGRATPKTWIGLDNYRELWNTPEIQAAFRHSVQLILYYAVFSIVIGLFLTALLTRFRVRGFLFFRTVLFMPQTIADRRRRAGLRVDLRPVGPLNEFLRTSASTP